MAVDNALPPSLAAEIADLKRRLERLELSPSLTQSSIKDGTLKVLDASGNVLVELGKIGTDYGIRVNDTAGHSLVQLGKIGTDYGVIVENANGREIFSVGTSGRTRPIQALPMIISGNVRPGTTSGSFDELWRCDFWSVGPSIDYDFTAFPNAGNMDWIIYCYEKGMAPVAVAQTLAISANTVYAGTITLTGTSTLDGFGADVAGRNMTIRVQAKRNSGVSTVDIALNGPFKNYG